MVPVLCCRSTAVFGRVFFAFLRLKAVSHASPLKRAARARTEQLCEAVCEPGMNAWPTSGKPRGTGLGDELPVGWGAVGETRRGYLDAGGFSRRALRGGEIVRPAGGKRKERGSWRGVHRGFARGASRHPPATDRAPCGRRKANTESTEGIRGGGAGYLVGAVPHSGHLVLGASVSRE